MQGSASGVSVSRGLCAALRVVMDHLKSFLNVSVASRKHKIRYLKEMCIAECYGEAVTVLCRVPCWCAVLLGAGSCAKCGVRPLISVVLNVWDSNSTTGINQSLNEIKPALLAIEISPL